MNSVGDETRSVNLLCPNSETSKYTAQKLEDGYPKIPRLPASEVPLKSLGKRAMEPPSSGPPHQEIAACCSFSHHSHSEMYLLEFQHLVNKMSQCTKFLFPLVLPLFFLLDSCTGRIEDTGGANCVAVISIPCK